MSNHPLLVLQMQRMGDLVLSFPLLGWLRSAFPGHPVWVVGEKRFYAPLLGLSPEAVYFDYTAPPVLPGQRFHAVINLSHRQEAAHIAGQAQTDALYGPYLDRGGALRIRGNWQLYRASLTHNNRYNLFHWADLNALDVISGFQMRYTDWPGPRPMPNTGTGRRIGLFLGASQENKRPGVPFWSGLARALLSRGHKPVLLGGPAEQALGREVASLAGVHSLNLCGNFSVSGLAGFLSRLDLLVTPDTGPMHVAAWTGTPVLNLSMGPVNPWETGPFAPGHQVLRARLDCTGCWECLQPELLCHAPLTPGRVAALVHALCAGAPCPAPGAELELSRTARTSRGLYALENAAHPECGRLTLARFWQAWFSAAFACDDMAEAELWWSRVNASFPQEARAVRQGAATLAVQLGRTVRSGTQDFLADAAFWKMVPPQARPLSGYLQMFLHNRDGGRDALRQGLALLESLVCLCSAPPCSVAAPAQ